MSAPEADRRPAARVAVLTAVAVLAWTAWQQPHWSTWPAYVVLALAWGAAMAVDLARHELPDRFTLLGALAFVLALLPGAIVQGEPGRWAMTLVAGLITAALLFVLAFINPAGFGLGDVKLGLSTGAALGWLHAGWPGVGLALTGTALAFVLSGLVGAVLLITRRANRDTDLAFGPFMVAGALLAPAALGLLS